MADITNLFGGPFRAPPASLDPPEVQLQDAMRAAGLDPPAAVHLDGQLHRFPTNGKRGDDAGWYVAFGDGIPAGRFGCWRDAIEQTWHADIGRDMTAAEVMNARLRQSEAQKLRDEARKRKADMASDTCEAIWSAAQLADAAHPYLKRKGIGVHGARVHGDGRLLVPLYGADGELSSLQYIAADGEKRYHPGGITSGRFWTLGDIASGGPLYIAEGFATAATIHEVTGAPVAIAYSAQNIVPVTGLLRERYGAQRELVIVADHDASGTGQNYATQAAAKHGARVVIPPEPGDANDMWRAGSDLAAFLAPPDEGWLIHADEFSRQPAPIRWLVKKWLQASALIMVHGPSGGGKTFVVLDWCLRIASGMEEWSGQRVRPGQVIYLAGEGHHGLRGRIAAWKQHHGLVNGLDMWLSSSGCDLNTAEGYRRVVDHIRAAGIQPRLIVVDTLHRFLHGDENSAQDAKTMLDACAGLMGEFDGASVLLVHHTGVSDEAQHRARGSSAWRGALENEVSVIPPKGDGPIELLVRKSKDAEAPPPAYVELQPVPIEGWFDEDGEQVTSAVIAIAEAPQPREDSKLATQRKTFERAWFHAGEEMIGSRPYVARAALERFMIENLAMKEGTIRQELKPSYARGMIGALTLAEHVAQEAHGWVVTDPAWAAQLALAKGVP